MKSFTAFAVLSAGVTQVFGAPVLDAREDGEELIWENSDGVGNTQISIGDGKMNFGHLVPSSTLDQIDEHCTATGCKPDEDLSVTALFVNSNYGSEADITMQVEGSFNAGSDRGSKSQLLELAKIAMEKLYEDGIAEREQGVIYQDEVCPGFNPLCNINDDAKYTDQWKSTNHISVRVDNDDDGGLAGFLNIGWSPPSESEPGVCGAFTAAGVALGLANAFTGAGLVLAGVACAEI